MDIRAHYDEYDGFVVLHGTDTMAYTASALSFMLENLPKPVIVTGSQIPLAQLRSDGQVNLLNSLYLAAYYPIAEVALYFNNQLFRGNRATKADADGFNAFASPNFPALLQAGIHIEVLAGQLSQVTATSAVAGSANHSTTHQCCHFVPWHQSLMSFRNMAAAPVRALIIKSYGVGNAPQDPTILAALTEAAQRGTVIVNCTQCFKGKVNMGGYATGNALKNSGVISGFDMTLEATLTKLRTIY
ncbi:MAG: asparaginase domain-containing protein [Rheinheimera sp.]|nr:asparaginase domain-containing protein [Rheinheimera sp.]